MSWDVLIYFQERGTKKEVYESVNFLDRSSAISAIDKLESDYGAATEEDMIVVDSGKDRVNFLRRDYRRYKLQEAFEGSLFD